MGGPARGTGDRAFVAGGPALGVRGRVYGVRGSVGGMGGSTLGRCGAVSGLGGSARCAWSRLGRAWFRPRYVWCRVRYGWFGDRPAWSGVGRGWSVLGVDLPEYGMHDFAMGVRGFAHDLRSSELGSCGHVSGMGQFGVRGSGVGRGRPGVWQAWIRVGRAWSCPCHAWFARGTWGSHAWWCGWFVFGVGGLVRCADPGTIDFTRGRCARPTHGEGASCGQELGRLGWVAVDGGQGCVVGGLPGAEPIVQGAGEARRWADLEATDPV